MEYRHVACQDDLEIIRLASWKEVFSTDDQMRYHIFLGINGQAIQFNTYHSFRVRNMEVRAVRLKILPPSTRKSAATVDL
jgi:hypothetical protein